MDSLTKQEYVRSVAKLIDKRINAAYHLHANNYIAFDLRYGTDRYSDKYTPSQKEEFLERLKELIRYESYELETLSDILLGIYANPINSRTSAISPI